MHLAKYPGRQIGKRNVEHILFRIIIFFIRVRFESDSNVQRQMDIHFAYRSGLTQMKTARCYGCTLYTYTSYRPLDMVIEHMKTI